MFLTERTRRLRADIHGQPGFPEGDGNVLEFFGTQGLKVDGFRLVRLPYDAIKQDAFKPLESGFLQKCDT